MHDLRKLCFQLLVCACLTLFAPSFASETWQTCLQAGQKALKSGDRQYGYFKLRQAWNAVGDNDYGNPAYYSIYRAFDGPLPSPGASVMRQFGTGLSTTHNNNRWSVWTVGKLADGSLALTTARNAFYGTNHQSLCWNGMTPQQVEATNEYEKTIDKLYCALPIIMSPQSEKYQDLAALCEPLKVNEVTAVTFNLSPFTPPEYTQIFGPIAVIQKGCITFDSNDNENRLQAARIGSK